MFLGIDLGTSELKAVLLETAHRVVASAGQPLTVERPEPLWSEQAPDAWWAALDRVLLQLRSAEPDAMAAVQAVGLSGQMHGAVLLDAADKVLRPAILWNDGRSGPQCRQLEATLASLHTIAGNLAMPGFTAPKLLWVREHEPALFERTARVLLPKDWLRLGMSGEAVSDMSDASGTLWLDIAQRAWSDALLDAGGMTRARMPALVEGSAVAARLRPALAARWGLPEGVPIAGGGGDNAASAVGIGAVRPGQGFVSLGTSGVVFLVSEGFRPNPAAAVHAFCHALPQRWHQMSVMLSAASALRWARLLLGLPSEAALLNHAATLTPAQRARAPLFLPYLAGERTPHNDPLAQGVLFGLTHEHDAAALGYAVMEGVSLGLVDGWRALQASPGAVEALTVVGGGSRSALWCQLLASAFGVPMQTRQGGEAGGAVGAARLAWLAAGGAEADACAIAPLAAEHTPNPSEAALLAERGARFRALYPLIRPAFTREQ